MAADVTYKQNDTSPALVVSAIKNGDGTNLNLSGASVKLLMREANGSTAKVSVTSTSTTLNITGSTSAGYTATYSWSTGDLDTAGRFEWELECTLASGAVVTVPNNKYYTLDVLDDIA